MIQDTSFLVDVLRGDEDAQDLLEVLERESQPEKVSSMTVLELHEGVIRSETPAEKRSDVLDVLESKHVVDADRTVMRKAGELSGQLITEGRRIEREDCVVAATALLADEPVVTGNVDHFERVPELTVRSY